MTSPFVLRNSTPVYDIRLSIIVQRNYCEKHQLPHFAPSDGVCFHCHNNIYWPHKVGDADDGTEIYSGIPTSKAANQLITGCPHCFYSFCE